MRQLFPVGLLVLACSLLAWSALAADGAAPEDVLVPGARVRVHAPDLAKRPLIGRIVAMDDTALTLRLRGGKERTIAVDEIRRLDVSAGAHPRLLGGAFGALVGGVSAAGIAGRPCRSHREDRRCEDRSAFTLVGGAVLGAAIGSVLSATETWAPVLAARRRVDVAVEPLPRRGWRAAVAIGF
jgi:hypothetical protein